MTVVCIAVDIVRAGLLFVSRGAENPSAIQCLYNFPVSIALYIHLENKLYMGGGFFVNDQMMFVGGINLIAIWSKRPDKLSLFSLKGEGFVGFLWKYP